jgi:hypothetical protein
VSSNGAQNDVNGNKPSSCDNSAETSADSMCIDITGSPQHAECLVAQADQCPIAMHAFQQLDYHYRLEGCQGFWTAPLWMTPRVWQWGPGSGEIDSLEQCPTSNLFMNFAGGGHQVDTTQDPNNAMGHVTVYKDDAGIVTTTHCTQAEAEANSGSCKRPTYADCADCLNGKNTYACWCNEATSPPNIYGSGGCRSGGDCHWLLVSDIWNGVTGDAGYSACTGSPTNSYKKDGHCKTSVTDIRLTAASHSQTVWADAPNQTLCQAAFGNGAALRSFVV